MAHGTHIELFLVDGEADGITTADIASWTGHILSGPRSRLADLLAREEAHRNGVYLLLGDDPESIDNTRCYIGKTEDFSKRFLDHDKKKDWWDRAVLISSSDDSFNEGHWGYIEARLVDIAMRAERATLDDNKQIPQRRKLSEAQKSDVEDFIDKIRIILPVLGITALKARAKETAQHRTTGSTTEESPVFHLEVPRRGIHARAQFLGGEFLLLEGSIVSGTWSGKGKADTTKRSYDSQKARFDKLIADGSITVAGARATVTRDIPFTSPSAAGAIASGRSCNGRIEWKTTEGLTYGDWEERGTELSIPSDSSALPSPPTRANEDDEEE